MIKALGWRLMKSTAFSVWILGLLALLLSANALSQSNDVIFKNGFEALPPGSLIAGSETPLRDSTIAAETIPLISTRFTPIGGGTQTFKLSVDGIDVSTQAQLVGDRISYTPAQALPEGNHTVQVTIGTAPSAVVSSWPFKSATPPVIFAESPFFTVIAPGQNIVLSASYSDVGAGIDVSGVRLEVDQSNVSAQSTITASAISCPR
jgi:hypothetical protein